MLRAGLVTSKDSITTLNVLKRLLGGQKVYTLTSDNGSEFALHKEIAKALDAKYLFADAYSSYQRGSNEHDNGMIRRYFPKKTDFKQVTDEELQKAIYKINHLPRKIHKGKTAHEVYYSINKSLIKSRHRKQFIFAFRT